MKFTQLDIYRSDDEIILHQDDVGMGDMMINITPDMVDLVCNELQRLKKLCLITESQRSGKNGK